MLALVADHGLRPASAMEADATLGRLAGLGISARLLNLDIASGSSAERARHARHAALERACAEAGVLHCLFGHHASDQAETVAMRRLRGSGPAGLSGMAALVETRTIRILRPLLDVAPVRLRRTLRAAGLDWVEDPSNADPGSERARLRALRRDQDGDGLLTTAACRSAAARGLVRASEEARTSEWLGRHATIRPGRGAVVDVVAIPAAAFAALSAWAGGRARLPPSQQVLGWLAAPRSATLAGCQIRREGSGWVFRPEPGGLPDKMARPLTPAWFCVGRAGMHKAVTTPMSA